MRKNKNKTILLILALLIGIGYAYISTNLNIVSNLTFQTNTWNVYFWEVRETHGAEFATVHPETDGSTTTDLSFSVHLPKPGDYYEMYATIYNGGSLDAMVSLVNTSVLSNVQQQYAEVLITYADNTPIEENHLLKYYDDEVIKVVVKYKEDITQEILESEKDPITINLSLEYTTANKNAKERDRVYTTMIGGTTLRTKMLSLANGNPIQHFRRVYEMDNQYKRDENLVSTSNSPFKVYAWYENGYINVYSDTSDNYIEIENLYRLFYNLTDLIDIDFEGFMATKAESMSSMCEGDTALETVNLNPFYMGNIEDAINAFKGCTHLESLSASISSKKLTDIRNMFEGCTSLKRVLLSLNENVQYMNGLFKNCSSLRSVSLYVEDDGKTDSFHKLREVESMFENCTSLVAINLNKIDFSSIENIYRMFYGCSSLQIIEVSENRDVNLDKAIVFQTNYEIFTGCISLRGQNGTTYDPNHTGSDYATVDGRRFNKTTNRWDYDETVKGYFDIDEVV